MYAIECHGMQCNGKGKHGTCVFSSCVAPLGSLIHRMGIPGIPLSTTGGVEPQEIGDIVNFTCRVFTIGKCQLSR